MYKNNNNASFKFGFQRVKKISIFYEVLMTFSMIKGWCTAAHLLKILKNTKVIQLQNSSSDFF